ncbi:MAG: CcmD family protein [Salinibacter sp.]
MTIHPLPDDGPALRPQQARPDTASAYDSTWTEQPASQRPEGLERVMLADSKIYVVLAVVLLIWAGLVTLLVRTDHKIDRLERRLEADRSSPDGS